MLTKDALDLAIQERWIPVRHQAIYRKAHSGQSRVASVKAMCLECQGWEDGAMKAVRECECARCPLHSISPYQVSEED